MTEREKSLILALRAALTALEEVAREADGKWAVPVADMARKALGRGQIPLRN